MVAKLKRKRIKNDKDENSAPFISTALMVCNKVPKKNRSFFFISYFSSNLKHFIKSKNKIKINNKNLKI